MRLDSSLLTRKEEAYGGANSVSLALRLLSAKIYGVVHDLEFRCI